MSYDLLELDGLDIHFQGVHALSEVSFGIDSGESLGLIGPNGAGKSSCINCISGLSAPQSGSIRFKGTDVVGMPPHLIARLGIARTFQGTELFDGLSAFENVLIAAENASNHFGSRRHTSARESAQEALSLLGLEHLSERAVSDLSNGDQKSVALARALAARPELVMLDEPTAGMNREEKLKVGTLIDTLRSEGVTILLVEHDVPFISTHCDRVVVLNFGELIAEGSPAAVAQDEFVRRAYLGRSYK